MVLSSSGTIFQSTNETRGLFLEGTLGAILSVSGIVIGKIEFVALGVTIEYIVNFITGYYILIKKVFKKVFLIFMSIYLYFSNYNYL